MNRGLYGLPTDTSTFTSSLEDEAWYEWLTIPLLIASVYLAMFCVLGSFFYVWTVTGQADEGMPAYNKGGRGGEGSNKKGRSGGGGGDGGDGDDDDDELARRMGRMDFRSPKEKQQDKERRLGTQCPFIGWFGSDPSFKKANNGKKHQFRRCRSNMSVEYFPWCADHYRKANEHPDDDLDAKDDDDDITDSPPDPKKKGGRGGGKKKNNKRRGLGDAN